MTFQQLFPLTDNIWMTVLVLMLILSVPALCRRLRFPQIAGLIIAGTVVGPGLLDIIETDAILGYAGRVGLLFIMFFAGIQTDLEEMKRNRSCGIAFGSLTFLIPFAACLWTGQSVLSLDAGAAGVIGCIMGSHTLVSFPIVSRFGIDRRKSVTISLTGALVAILIALVLYSVLISDSKGASSVLFLLLKLTCYVAAVVLIYPRITRRFFRQASSNFSHFLFVMLLLAVACALARLIGLDAILGAFLAGLMMNRYVPNTSPLMHRMDFIGNALLIPVFLLTTGMMIDIRGVCSDWNTLRVFAIVFIAGSAAKWIAAFVIQKVSHFDRDDRLILFGLSESHAAGALAITTGAYSIGMISLAVLSATVLIVLFSCILSNIVTEHAANRIFLKGRKDESNGYERLLVTLTGSNTLEALMDTAMTIRPRKGPEMVGLYVTVGGEHATKYMQDGKGRLQEAAAIAASADVPFVVHNRLGNNIVESIVHATKEFDVTSLIMGMPLRRSITTYYYENIVRPLLENVSGEIVLQRMTSPLNTVRRIVVLVPGPVIQDNAFAKSIGTVFKICTATGCDTVFYGKVQAIDAVRGAMKGSEGGRISFCEVSETVDMDWAINELHDDHMLVIIGARDTESHAARSFHHLYEHIHLKDNDFSTMLVFPSAQVQDGTGRETGARTSRDLLKMLRV